MKIVTVGTEAENNALKGILGKLCPASRLVGIPLREPSGSSIYGEIRRIGPELLITVNLAGFELLTQRKGVLYNLLDCKSLHLLTKRGLKNESCLAKQLSIAMFFFCVGEDYHAYLRKNYPDMPFLGTMGSFMTEQAPAGSVEEPYWEAALAEILNKLQRETGLEIN